MYLKIFSKIRSKIEIGDDLFEMKSKKLEQK